MTTTHFSRRTLLTAAAGTGAGLMLAGCASPTTSGGSGPTAGKTTLSFQTWANDTERLAFEQLIADYQSANPDVTIDLRIVSASSMHEKLQASLAAGNAPDLARCSYQNLGRYSGAGVLLDLTDHVPADFNGSFVPALWSAVTHEGRLIAVPHHTGSHVLYYNVKMFDEIGVTSFPQTPEEGWTWEEFLEISRKLKEKGTSRYPLAPAWDDASNAYRWMWLLNMRGGNLLNEQLSAPAIDSAAGVETIQFTKSWFEDGIVPPNSSIKTSEAPQQLFSTGTVAMMLKGASQMSYLREHMTEEWGITYLMRDLHPASDMGGNTMVATKDTKHPELAADFLQFLAKPEQMSKFCATVGFLPTRPDVLDTIVYEDDPEHMKVFVEQSRHVHPQMAAEQTVPEFNSINTVLGDQLELAFKSGQSARDTARNIAEGLTEVLK